MNYFSELIGQESVKRKLSFYIKAFEKTSQAPFLLLSGAKGLGKTEFAKAFAKNLSNKEGDKRAFLELNCSTIKNNEQFFEQIFLPLIMDNEITILFDECHACSGARDKKAADALGGGSVFADKVSARTRNITRG